MNTDGHLVENHYDQDPLHEWQRLERHRTEWAVTLRALHDHLPSPPGTVIDIGGGPGRYAIALSQMGYTVTLVDLAAGNLAFAAEKAAAAGVEIDALLQANALDLAEINDATFDAALLLGPLYHLLQVEERRQAVSEGLRVLKPGGRLAAAFITRFAPFRHGVRWEPQWIMQDPAYTQQVLETGIHDRDFGLPQVYFAHPEEIRPFMESCGLRASFMVGCEGIASGNRDLINELEGEAWQAWVELNYRLGQEPSLYGAAEHLLFVGEKVG